MMNSKSLLFPVVAFKHNDKYLYTFFQSKELNITSIRLYEKEIYKNVFFIDSRGRQFIVRSTKRLGWGTLLFGYSLMHKGRLIEIDFDLELLKELSLEEFKEIVYPKAKSSLPYFSEVEEKFASALSYAEVIQTIK
jgi:hypothetical protein